VLDFIDRFRFHKAIYEDKRSLLNYSQEVSDRHPLWDVAFISLKTPSRKSDDVMPVALQQREVGIDSNPEASGEKIPKCPPTENGWYVGNKQRVSGKGVEKVGLTDNQIRLATQSAHKNKKKVPADVDYRNARNKPLLMIHLLELINESAENVLMANAPAIGFSFPFTGDNRTVEYIVNPIWIKNFQFDSQGDEDDYDK
jgi:hypothetical protein